MGGMLCAGPLACGGSLGGGPSCQMDSDCLGFGAQPLFGGTPDTESTIATPTCQNGLCVNTGVSCVVGAPTSGVDFSNQCTASGCLPFDNCTRLALCDAGLGAGPALLPPPATAAGTAAGMGETGATAYPVPGLCADMPPGPAGVVYVIGSSNFSTLLSNMAPLLWTGVAPLSAGPAVVFLASGSCQAADAIDGPDASAGIIIDPPDGSPAASYAQYYLPDGGTTPCSLGPNGVEVAVGESDLYATTCNASYETTSGIDTLGPIQAMEFVVPSTSDQLAISQEAAREVFGTGGNDGVAYPWTNPQRYYVQGQSSGTQQMIAAAIGVPPAQFWGVSVPTAAGVLSDLQSIASNPSEAEQAIGILPNSVYDADRSNVRCLAYEGAGQNCAFLPDSTLAAYDKQNVRDGHYPIWGPLHFFTSNQPTAAAQTFIRYFNGAQLSPEILDAFIAADLIPACAMSVAHSQNEELSELVSYLPQYSCECFFLGEAQPPAPGAPTSTPPYCQPCIVATDCPASRPACNLGFCEVQ